MGTAADGSERGAFKGSQGPTGAPCASRAGLTVWPSDGLSTIGDFGRGTLWEQMGQRFGVRTDLCSLVL